jgi:hypothetical protein
MLNDTFGKVPKSRSRSGIGIEITYRSDPFYPQPLPGINTSLAEIDPLRSRIELFDICGGFTSAASSQCSQPVSPK